MFSTNNDRVVGPTKYQQLNYLFKKCCVYCYCCIRLVPIYWKKYVSLSFQLDLSYFINSSWCHLVTGITLP